MKTRSKVGLFLGVLALVAIFVLSQPRVDPYTRPELDPRGTGPAGTAGLVETLSELGATVRVGDVPTAADDVVLMLRPTLQAQAQQDLLRWIDSGGTLVKTDSSFQHSDSEPKPSGKDCTLEALRDIEQTDPPLIPFTAPTPKQSFCFGQRGYAGLIVQGYGTGQIITLADHTPFTNRFLAKADNAELMATLMYPTKGTAIRILDPYRIIRNDKITSDGTLIGALPLRGRQAAFQVAVAFIAWGLIRGRRLGKPVIEDLPAPIPASDLVLAHGRLMDMHSMPHAAGEHLRRTARRRLGQLYGLGVDPNPIDLANTLAAQTRVDHQLIEDALLKPIETSKDLLRASYEIDRLVQETTQ